jgi:hypothetical protein
MSKTSCWCPRRSLGENNGCRYLFTHSHKGHKRARKANELDLYYAALAEDVAVIDPREKDPLVNRLLLWWRQIGCKEYPTLFKIALGYHSISCTSCDCERAFGTAKRTSTGGRNQLGASTIEAQQLQKNWLRNEVVNSYIAIAKL